MNQKPYSYQDYITNKKVIPSLKCTTNYVENFNNPTITKPIYTSYNNYNTYIYLI